ncbi:glycerate kinase [Candidatus Bathyarchaeota archaeon]|nr:glycerate kinase [Candidatus Bathyarchaeota archaeon]MBS7628738.1 glycerate kinase [Candidatus Bathyarchaeota archaeon]
MEHIHLKDSNLIIDGEEISLNKYRNILVVGGGKAVGAMAEALEDVLGDKIKEGLVNILTGTAGRYRTRKIKLNEAGHPIPDLSGMVGTKRMFEMVENARKEDLIICLISGGGSAMMTLPARGVSIEDKQKLTKLLLLSGANINEINIVRKHLSMFKGGQLAKAAFPATTVSLILSDVVGDPIDSIASGPTAPDPTTYRDAIEILRKYDLWDKTPDTIKNVLDKGSAGLLPETPKPDNPIFENVRNIIVGNNLMACKAAKAVLKNLGFKTLILTTRMQGESREVGIFLGSIAKEISSSGNPQQPPAAIVVGGETTVTVRGRGLGGRNQELVLSAAKCIADRNGVCIGSIGTDGIDGPTDAAGALVDGETLRRANELGLDYGRALMENDSYNFFRVLDDLLITGPTGSNVNDVAILCVCA